MSIYICSKGLYQVYNSQPEEMINEITINFNNATDMSRGDLLNWVNELLKTNLSKIEQLGSGSAYCQLIDILYPGKIPLSKVNFKAKFEYEFVNNFKILQQTFTKIGIMKHVDVEKLIKCKVQDNLEFLQWFRKIFESSGNATTVSQVRKEKENKGSISSAKDIPYSSSKNYLDTGQKTQRSGICQSFVVSERTDYQDQTLRQSDFRPQSHLPVHTPEGKFIGIDSRWNTEINSEAFKEEKQFYLKKFKEIEHLCQTWNTNNTSQALIQQIRKIILVAPEVDWCIEEGQYKERVPEQSTEKGQAIVEE